MTFSVSGLTICQPRVLEFYTKRIITNHFVFRVVCAMFEIRTENKYRHKNVSHCHSLRVQTNITHTTRTMSDKYFLLFVRWIESTFEFNALFVQNLDRNSNILKLTDYTDSRGKKWDIYIELLHYSVSFFLWKSVLSRILIINVCVELIFLSLSRYDCFFQQWNCWIVIISDKSDAYSAVKKRRTTSDIKRNDYTCNSKHIRCRTLIKVEILSNSNIKQNGTKFCSNIETTHM